MIAVISLPVLDQIAESLETTGQYHTELTADDITSIIHAIAGSVLAGQKIVGGRIERLENRITDERGTASGVIAVARPVSATLDVALAFVNDAAPDRIKLESVTITQNAGFPARLVLQALDLDGKVRRSLADPNGALQDALARQLRPRGLEVTSVGLHLGSSTLNVDIWGGAGSPRE
jgi:hypothetical protein